MNVVQLTLTRETASWLARQDQRDDQGHPAVTPAGAGRGGAWSADESYVRAPISREDLELERFIFSLARYYKLL